MGGIKNAKALVCLTLILLVSSAKGKGRSHNKNLESLYPAYQLIKDTINGDPKSMFKLSQAFLPAMNNRYWYVDGVEIIPIKVHISFYDDVQEQARLVCNTTEKELQETVTWKFTWTNSLLMSLIPGDILLAMDDTIITSLYSEIVQSFDLRIVNLNLQINRSFLLYNFSLGDLQQASAFFLSMSKNEILSVREPKYQGYVSLLYTYYHYDSYFSKLVTGIGRSHITNILTGLWITFGILNLSLPIFSITRRKQLLQWLKTTSAATNVRLFRAIILCITLFNTMYIPAMLIIHIKGYPEVLQCYLSTANRPCTIPPTTTAYNYVIGILITKLAILPFALLTELSVAVYTAKQLSTGKRCTFFTWAFVIWQLLLFVQISVGLITIPLLLLIFISPVHTILLTCAITLIFILITFILSTIPLSNSCNAFRLKGVLKSVCTTAEVFVIVLLILSAFMTYFVIVKDGVNMSGVKVYVISLIPTIPISILIWVIKKKYLRERVNQKTRPRLARSLSAEEEMIGLLSAPSETEDFFS